MAPPRTGEMRWSYGCITLLPPPFPPSPSSITLLCKVLHHQPPHNPAMNCLDVFREAWYNPPRRDPLLSSGPCRSKYSNSMSEPQMLIQATYPPAYLLIRRLIRCWRTDLSTALKPSFTFSRPPFRAERRGINVAAVINQVMESWNNLLPLLQVRQILAGPAVSDLRKIRRENDKKA